MTAKEDTVLRLLLLVIVAIVLCFMLVSCGSEQKICGTYGTSYSKHAVKKQINHQPNYKLVRR